MPGKLSPETVERIRKLRYEDGLQRQQIADHLGVNRKSVTKYAPGQFIGKVSNEPVREVFLASKVPARQVALALGWTSPQAQRRGVAKLDGDSSRVLRTLGLRQEHQRYKTGYRQMIDAEVAMNIAEACGVAGWSVVPDEAAA